MLKKLISSRSDTFALRKMSEDDFITLVNHLPSDIQMVCLIGYYTAGRLGELLSMKVKDVNLKRRTIHFEGMFCKSGRTVPIAKPLLPLLKTLIRDKCPEDNVLTHTGRPLLHSQIYFQRKFHKEIRKARIRDRICFYDIRHLAIMKLCRENKRLSIVAKITGQDIQILKKRFGRKRNGIL